MLGHYLGGEDRESRRPLSLSEVANNLWPFEAAGEGADLVTGEPSLPPLDRRFFLSRPLSALHQRGSQLLNATPHLPEWLGKRGQKRGTISAGELQ